MSFGTDFDERLQEMFDHYDIVKLMTGYARALDSHNWEALESIFTPDAVADYGEDLAAKNEGLETIIETCKTALCGLTSSQHLVGNFVVNVDGDKAVASCYLHAQHYLVSASGVNTFVVGGTYTDQLIRTSDGWRIEYRTLESTFTDGNAGIFAEGAARLEAGEASR